MFEETRLSPRVLLLLLLIMPIAARAVIVDRIAISAGNKIITESEIDERIRLTAFQNQVHPDLSLASRRRAAQQLIDQKLIEREMDVGHYPRVDPERRKALLAAYEKATYKSDAGSMESALAACGLTSQELEDDLARQSDLLTFLSLRFRPAVQVTDQDVQKYFADSVRNGAFNEMRAEIEERLTGERADKELDLWLRDQRKRTRIEYMEKDLAPK
jgi:hypothetical protein